MYHESFIDMFHFFTPIRAVKITTAINSNSKNTNETCMMCMTTIGGSADWLQKICNFIHHLIGVSDWLCEAAVWNQIDRHGSRNRPPAPGEIWNATQLGQHRRERLASMGNSTKERERGRGECVKQSTFPTVWAPSICEAPDVLKTPKRGVDEKRCLQLELFESGKMNSVSQTNRCAEFMAVGNINLWPACIDRSNSIRRRVLHYGHKSFQAITRELFSSSKIFVLRVHQPPTGAIVNNRDSCATLKI